VPISDFVDLSALFGRRSRQPDFLMNWSTMTSNDERVTGEETAPTAGQWAMFGGHWCFYTDASGNRVQLGMAVRDGRVVLTMASGEVLTFTGSELGMLLENLGSVAGRSPSV
jgi:hypothetical protein